MARDGLPPAIDGVEARLDAIHDVLAEIRDRLPEPARPAEPKGEGTVRLREEKGPAAGPAPHRPPGAKGRRA